MVTDVSPIEERGGWLRGRAVTLASTALTVLRSNAPIAQVVRFGWHYVQMSIAMYLGMLLPVGLILSVLGLSCLLRSPWPKRDDGDLQACVGPSNSCIGVLNSSIRALEVVAALD